MRMAESGGDRCFPAGWTVPAKRCDSCKTAVALLFCRKDSVFLCLECDVKMHHGHTRRHERVWMCEVCEQAPASVTCKADAAALCVTCDGDIHSANPLSRRHDRIPVVPFYDCPEILVRSSACTLLEPSSGNGNGNDDLNSSVTNEADINWGIPPDIIDIDAKFPSDDSLDDMKSIEMLFPESDQLLDFEFPVPTDGRLHSHFHDSGNDSVVPFQTTPPAQNIDHRSWEKRYEFDFTRSKINSYNRNSYLSQSLSQSVSSTSIDAGVVPEGNSMSDISHPFMLQVNTGAELNGATNLNQQPAKSSGMDREARVMRYREKRKYRKFEKTIRYASRKAYAETRPRIKGRFAKRTESVEDSDVGRWLFTAASGVSAKSSYSGEVEYGVVPSY